MSSVRLMHGASPVEDLHAEFKQALERNEGSEHLTEAASVMRVAAALVARDTE
jgi:hypothetical protein